MGKVAVKVESLTKSFVTDQGQVRAVQGISFEIEQGAFFTLLGPSGCGKTTTLRCVAGLERPEAGEITIDDTVVVSTYKRIFVPPHERDIGMVFQSYAIWPHMTVFENVAFPLTQGKQKYTKAEIREKVLRALDLVKLTGLEKRPAPQLSGGQQQRLALARALVREPKVLLLDEPLSNLDAKLREEMRIELRHLTRRLHITTLYVTHDQLEALTMSDVVAIMRDGKIVQISEPREVYTAPENKFAAEFVGTTNLFEGVVTDHVMANGLGCVETRYGLMRCWLPKHLRAGERVAITVRPENIVVLEGAPPAGEAGTSGNVLEGRVETVTFLGDFLDCRVLVGDQLVRVKLHPSSLIREGQRVYLSLPEEQCKAVPVE